MPKIDIDKVDAEVFIEGGAGLYAIRHVVVLIHDFGRGGVRC